MSDDKTLQSPEIRPLSHRATRILVVLSVLIAFAAAIGGALYLIKITRQTGQQPALEQTPGTPSTDSTQTDAIPRR